MFRVHNGQHPRLLRLLLSEKISVQTIIILDKVLSFIKRWDKEIAENVIRKINVKLKNKVVTKISLLNNYCIAEEYHQKYLEKS